MERITDITSLPECIDLCMDREMGCLGVVYVAEPQNLCFPKSRMVEDGVTSGDFESAVRVSGPATLQAPFEVILNGCFANELSPWTTPESSDTASLVWREDTA